MSWILCALNVCSYVLMLIDTCVSLPEGMSIQREWFSVWTWELLSQKNEKLLKHPNSPPNCWCFSNIMFHLTRNGQIKFFHFVAGMPSLKPTANTHPWKHQFSWLGSDEFSLKRGLPKCLHFQGRCCFIAPTILQACHVAPWIYGPLELGESGSAGAPKNLKQPIRVVFGWGFMGAGVIELYIQVDQIMQM